MSIDQRLAWARIMSNNFEGWFNNVVGVLEAFKEVGAGASGSWISIVDAHILVGIQDGLQLARGEAAMFGGEGADLWKLFFVEFINPNRTVSKLREYWGKAEQKQTDIGVLQAAARGVLPTAEEQFFLGIGNAYRTAVANPGTSMGQLTADALGRVGYCSGLECSVIRHVTP
jgi:hypothetical protein